MENIKIKLIANDNNSILISYKALILSETLKNICDDLKILDGLLINPDDPKYNIPITNANSEILNLFVKHAERYKDRHVEQIEHIIGKPKEPPIMDDWEREFIKLNNNILIELLALCHYLDYKSLFNISAYIIAMKFINKSPEQIRKEFNIKNDFTPEDLEKMEKEDKWMNF
jgi:S-phase kinase-associated protein 1